MALEAVIYQQDPFLYTCKDIVCNFGAANYTFALDDDGKPPPPPINDEILVVHSQESPPSSVVLQNANTASSPDTFAGDGFFNGGVSSPATEASGRRKRRRRKCFKNTEQMENQRMTHIAVERNRRKLMNNYLAILRSLMPPSYAQRGDQASIVGGAINFVKELEQLLQSLEANKPIDHQNLSNFFTFPQYSMGRPAAGEVAASSGERGSTVAEVEVTMVESHANIKILSKRRPKQLLKLVSGLHSLSLTTLHLNITTVDHSALYTFSVKVEDECQLSTVNEIATAVHDMVGMIQQECNM